MSGVEQGSLNPMCPVSGLGSNQTHLIAGPLFPYPIRASYHKVLACALPISSAILLPTLQILTQVFLL